MGGCVAGSRVVSSWCEQKIASLVVMLFPCDVRGCVAGSRVVSSWC